MHPALWKLLRLTDKASWRTLFRGARTVRGALLLIFLIGIAGLYVVFLVGITFFMRGRTDFPDFTGSAAPYLPLILLAIFLQAVLGSRGTGHLYFSPAEIAFLFAGPFHRRDLLLYKLIRRGFALVVGSLMISVTPVSWFLNGSLSAFVGLSLALVFVNLASLAATLARLIVEEAAQTRIRKMVLLAVTTLVVVALPQTFSRAPVLRFATLAASFRETWPGRVLLAPFEVFSNAMLAERLVPRPDRLGPGGGGDRPGPAGPGPEARCRLSRMVHDDQPAGVRADRADAPERRVRDEFLEDGGPASGSRSSPGWAAPAPSPGGRWSSRPASPGRWCG